MASHTVVLRIGGAPRHFGLGSLLFARTPIALGRIAARQGLSHQYLRGRLILIHVEWSKYSFLLTDHV
jgi:hypothetical protein